ncbi:hypothetical protein [Flavobacterium sp. HBTb2-11-1]|uniref:hypothetical protein n=1 Tax=Flavobacterium sp. HBTb2-11-1 TaxID=2692212 RepID=UPI00136A7EC1|nr:hypothetical protein [Flavobacterium sp. HBTb2-11-1]MXO06170.1 hypothetical protein [Flavobacterium sp. HBTb2-11-1]
MTIVIIIVVIIIILYFTHQKEKNITANYNINKGGYRKSFETLTHILENYYEMTFINDTGTSFNYGKDVINKNGFKGRLIIGVKISFDKPLLYSKYVDNTNMEYFGTNISILNYSNAEQIKECVEISLKQIKNLIATVENNPISKQTIGDFVFGSKFEIENNQVKIIKCEPSKTTLTHKKFADKEEIEIHYHKTDTKSEYLLLKPLKMTIGNDEDYIVELFDKVHKINMTIIINSNYSAFDLRTSLNSKEGWTFSNMDMRYFINKNNLEDIVARHFIEYTKHKNRIGYYPQGLNWESLTSIEINSWARCANLEIKKLLIAKQYPLQQIREVVGNHRNKLLEKYNNR